LAAGLHGRRTLSRWLYISDAVSATNLVEHPWWWSTRIMRYGEVAGRKSVTAGSDYLLGLGGRIRPKIASAKLEAPVAGAKLARKELWT
jgi:hypothetical protein